MTDIDIHQAIAVYIGKTNARTPGTVSFYIGLPGNIRKMKIAIIQKKLIGAGIAGKKNIH